MTTCGTCKQMGHNARTCKGGVQTVDAPSVQSARATPRGFSVEANITHVIFETAVDGMMQVCYGVDDKGREIVWTFHTPKPPSVGDIVTVRGASIIRYSGEDGPWGRAAEPLEMEEA